MNKVLKMITFTFVTLCLNIIEISLYSFNIITIFVHCFELYIKTYLEK